MFETHLSRCPSPSHGLIKLSSLSIVTIFLKLWFAISRKLNKDIAAVTFEDKYSPFVFTVISPEIEERKSFMASRKSRLLTTQ